jgi:uncharacterized protein (TIGR02231 family)
MKKTIMMLLLLIIFNYVFAGEKEKIVKSEIKEVTIFLNGAQITRTGESYLNQGTTYILFQNLSPYINPTTIQVKGEGNFTILSVRTQLNYLNSIAVSNEVKQINDSIELLQDDFNLLQSMQNVYSEEEAMIIANKTIGGQDVGVKVSELILAADFYRTRLTDVKTKQLEIQKKTKKINEKIVLLTNQLNLVNENMNKPSGEIIIAVAAKEDVNAKFTFSYATTNANWTPIYDLRATDINNPINLNFKSKIKQTTGEDWKDIFITLSTGNPNQSGARPILVPWYLTFYYPYLYNDNTGGTFSTSEKVGDISIKGSRNEGVVSYIDGVKVIGSNDLGSFVNVVENQTNMEYKISIPYTVLSDGKEAMIDVQNYTLPAQYQYYCVPKLDVDAFLMARVSGWEQYNLLSGEINLFYEGTYVGKSYVDVRNTNDTLDISLGRDKNIVVTRTKIKDFQSRQFIGNNKKDVYGWEIIVKNKKKQPIDIVLEDQIPLSTDKDIEIEKIEISNADYNKTTGKLLWTMKLNTGESKTFKLSYSVKYPKDKILNN